MRIRYRGPLSRKRTADEHTARLHELVKRASDVDLLAWDRTQVDPKDRGVRLLFDHYAIDSESTNAWRNLALMLAREHVPYFQTARPRGPARKASAIADFVAYGSAKPQPRSRGAPRKWNALEKAFLLWLEKFGRRRLAAAGRELTARGALLEALTHLLVRNGVPPDKARRIANAEAKSLDKRLSDAKRPIR
jgi:hypothetical protein